MIRTAILIVEDEAIVAADLASKLEDLGYAVAGIAAQGRKAVEMALELNPDLVLMDIRLEGDLDGIQAAEAIRESKDVPVVYLTAHSDLATLSRAKLTGPLGYILKPFEERDLATQIELALYKHQVDRQAREQREWLRVTLRSIGDAVIATDLGGRITFLNPVAEALTGWAMAEAAGKPVEEIFRIVNEFTRTVTENPVARVLQTGQIVGLANHTLLLTRDGGEIPIDDSGAPIRDEQGRVSGVVLVFRDISQRRQAEKALQESETSYRNLFDHNHAVLLLIDPLQDGRIVNANSAACAFYGYSLDEMTRLKISDINIMPSDKVNAEIQTAKAARGRHFFFTHRLADGHLRDVEVFSGPVSIKGHELLYSIVHDITDRKQAEEALREERRKLEAVVENLDVGIIISNAAETVLFMNSAALKMHGFASPSDMYTQREQFTRNFEMRNLDGSIMPPEERPALRSLRGDFFSNLELKVCDLRTGRSWIGSWGVSPVKNNQGEVQLLVFTVQDITERKRAEASLQDLNETLEQKVAERTELARARARQLQYLAVEVIEAEERERRRLAELLHDDLQQVLAFARMQLQLACESLPPNDMLANVERLLVESIGKSRRLSHELSPPALYHSGLLVALKWLVQQMETQFGLQVELVTEVELDLDSAPLKLFLFRAVQELLFNVVKHAGVKSARIVLSELESGLAITVSDEGCGFSPEILNCATITPGLGLLSLRERARHIGGDLVIESSPGQGCRFMLTVPFTLGKSAAPMPFSPAVQQRSSEPSRPDRFMAEKGIRVLFADDHKVMRQGLISMVRNQPGIHVVGEAANGREAVDMTLQLRPDVVVMDVSMPELDGVKATERIKAELPGIRVVGLSMFEDEHLARTMHQAGAEAYLSKTASAAELLMAIYGLTNQRKDE